MVRLVRGSLDIHLVLEDVFRMSALAWSAPDKCIRLPIGLKLCDEFLRATAADADDDEARFGEESEADVEGLAA